MGKENKLPGREKYKIGLIEISSKNIKIKYLNFLLMI